MKRIAIVSAASSSDKNTGMQTVEFGAASLQDEFPNVEFNWFTFPASDKDQKSEFYKYQRPSISYFELPNALPELYSHDVIIFWGDFLNSHTWIKTSAKYQLAPLGLDDKEMYEVSIKTMLLSEASDDVLRKVILFGGTILPDRQIDYVDESYWNAFSRLIQMCHRVWMRDPISSARISLIRGNSENCLGVDPAFFMKQGRNINLINQRKRTNGNIGLFVGSRTNINKELPFFIEQLSDAFNSKVEWIPWFGKLQNRKNKFWISSCINPNRIYKSFRSLWNENCISTRIEKNLFCKYKTTGKDDLFSLLERLSTYKFIITDTYHLCLNAWRLGIPAVCLGENEPLGYRMSTLLDTKKFIFYLQHGIIDLYITPDKIKTKNILSEFDNTFNSDQIFNANKGILTAALLSKKHLVEEITTLLKL